MATTALGTGAGLPYFIVDARIFAWSPAAMQRAQTQSTKRTELEQNNFQQ
jgi:hypothetical protein